ncbi:MAG: DinB family protein [Ktedonobacteraceae bacterium]|nr:DinB family protein [Ktedonobacteraceae bacterium]
MAEQPMKTTLHTALWRQFGAAIDMLENALVACPDTLWQGHLWIDSEGPEYGTFWDITYHTLCWLDLYLTGCSVEEFTPPAPFKKRSDDVIPKQPYSRDELHTYLIKLRKKCQTTIAELSDEKAHQQFTFPWPGGMSVSFLELQLYSMRHVQEHAAQLSLFLGQHAIPDEALDWVPRAKDEAGL